MEARDAGGQFVDVRRSDLVVRQQQVHPRGAREAAHVHCIFDGGFAAEHRLFRAAADGDDIEVDIRGKAAVDAQLFGAIEMARLQRRKSRKPRLTAFLIL